VPVKDTVKCGCAQSAEQAPTCHRWNTRAFAFLFCSRLSCLIVTVCFALSLCPHRLGWLSQKVCAELWHGWGWRHLCVPLVPPSPNRTTQSRVPSGCRRSHQEEPPPLSAPCAGALTLPSTAVLLMGSSWAPGCAQSPALSLCTSCRDLWPWWDPCTGPSSPSSLSTPLSRAAPK